MNHTICPWHPYGACIELRCKNHPHLTWSTKNIDCIGAHSIFFDPRSVAKEPECDCHANKLYHECADSIEWKRLTEGEK
jgi:hypothetical protein